MFILYLWLFLSLGPLRSLQLHYQLLHLFEFRCPPSTALANSYPYILYSFHSIDHHFVSKHPIGCDGPLTSVTHRSAQPKYTNLARGGLACVFFRDCRFENPRNLYDVPTISRSRQPSMPFFSRVFRSKDSSASKQAAKQSAAEQVPARVVRPERAGPRAGGG